MYCLVNPWDHTIYRVIQNFPVNHPTQKLLNPILQTDDSRFRWKNHIERDEPTFPRPRPRWTCCPGISGIYYYFIFHREIPISDNFPGSQFSLSRGCNWSIHKTFHDSKSLLIRSLSLFYIITKTRECCISSSVFHLVTLKVPSSKYQTGLLE